MQAVMLHMPSKTIIMNGMVAPHTMSGESSQADQIHDHAHERFAYAWLISKRKHSHAWPARQLQLMKRSSTISQAMTALITLQIHQSTLNTCPLTLKRLWSPA